MSSSVPAWRVGFERVRREFENHRRLKLFQLRYQIVGETGDLPTRWRSPIEAAEVRRETLWHLGSPGLATFENPKKAVLYGDQAAVELFDQLATEAWQAVPGSREGKAQFAQFAHDDTDRWLHVVYRQLDRVLSEGLDHVDRNDWVILPGPGGTERLENARDYALPMTGGAIAGPDCRPVLEKPFTRCRITRPTVGLFAASLIALDSLLADRDPEGMRLVSFEEMQAWQRSPAFQNANHILDFILLGNGQRFPIRRYCCEVIAGGKPSVCPKARPGLPPEFLPTIAQLYRQRGITRAWQTVHWVGDQTTLESVCMCSLAKSPPNEPAWAVLSTDPAIAVEPEQGAPHASTPDETCLPMTAPSSPTHTSRSPNSNAVPPSPPAAGDALSMLEVGERAARSLWDDLSNLRACLRAGLELPEHELSAAADRLRRWQAGMDQTLQEKLNQLQAAEVFVIAARKERAYQVGWRVESSGTSLLRVLVEEMRERVGRHSPHFERTTFDMLWDSATVRDTLDPDNLRVVVQGEFAGAKAAIIEQTFQGEHAATRSVGLRPPDESIIELDTREVPLTAPTGTPSPLREAYEAVAEALFDAAEMRRCHPTIFPMFGELARALSETFRRAVERHDAAELLLEAATEAEGDSAHRAALNTIRLINDALRHVMLRIVPFADAAAHIRAVPVFNLARLLQAMRRQTSRATMRMQTPSGRPVPTETPSDPSVEPICTKPTEPARKGKGINEKMAKRLGKEPESLNWSAETWAVALKCRRSTIHATPTWKGIMAARAVHRADRATRSGHNGRRSDDD